jgi:hypothetical protein
MEFLPVRRAISKRDRVVAAVATIATGAILAVAACRDIPPTAPRAHAPAQAAREILDAAHGGTPHFYFLPPMVAARTYSGVFDASLAPIVEICALNNGTCASPLVATYTTTSGVGSEVVRVNTTDQNYLVNWNTGAFPLDLSQIYRITVKVVATELGHCDVRLVNNGSAAKNASTGEDIVLVDGKTLPIKFRVEQGAVAVIGSTGGVAKLDDGAVTLTFPSGAVSAPIAVTATPIAAGSAAASDGSVIAGTQYEFQPSPTTFASPVTLTLSYPSALSPRVKASRLAICKMTSGACVALQGGGPNTTNRTVTAPVSSFSVYGLTTFPEMLYRVPSTATDFETDGWFLHLAAGEVPFPKNIAVGFDGPFASWSPDGSKLAYDVGGGGFDHDQELHIVDADGTQDHKLLDDARCRPQWSSDGTRLLVGKGSPFTAADDFVIIAVDGTVLERFHGLAVGSPTNGWVMAPCTQAWAPNGQIAFKATRYANTDSESTGIWVMNPDGTNLRLLISAEPNDHGFPPLAWSTDGSRVAFFANWAGTIVGSGVYVASADGTNLRRLLPRLQEYAWSTVAGDNRQVFMASGDPYRGDYYGYGNSREGFPWADGIYVIAADGTNQQPVVLNCAGCADVPLNPSWSPDGRRIAMEWQGTTYFVNIDGSGLQALFSSSPRALSALWRP